MQSKLEDEAEEKQPAIKKPKPTMAFKNCYKNDGAVIKLNA